MAISSSHIWVGCGPEPIGHQGPGTSPKVSLMNKATCSAQSVILILPKNSPWTPPLKTEKYVPHFIKLYYHRYNEQLPTTPSSFFSIINLLPFNLLTPAIQPLAIQPPAPFQLVQGRKPTSKQRMILFNKFYLCK